MKRILLLLVVMTMIVPMVFAQAAAEKSSSTVELTLLNSKPEITEALESAAQIYQEKTGTKITVFETSSPGDYMTQAYAAGDAPTLALVDYANIRDFSAEYLLDLSGEKWADIGGLKSGAIFDGKLYGFPFAIEARGVIYNKTVIEKTLGRDFDPSEYKTREQFAALLAELRANGMENPIVLNSVDWSIGSHYLQTLYSLYDGTMDGGYEFTSKLKDGYDIATDQAFNEAFDTLDLFIEYNYNKEDPLAADYDMNASYVADGSCAFWLNGTFAWGNMVPFIEDGVEYGTMALPVSENSPACGKISGSATKYIGIDKKFSTPEQQQAALDFLNWLVYSEEGQDTLVNKCGVVPAFSNITLPANNPLNISLTQYIASGDIICAFSDIPSDHRGALGADMQKYIASTITREEVAADMNAYWRSK